MNCGCFEGNNCCWIIVLIILFWLFCGNGCGNGCGNNSVANTCGCGNSCC